MKRPPFDPKRMRVPSVPPGGALFGPPPAPAPPSPASSSSATSVPSSIEAVGNTRTAKPHAPASGGLAPIRPISVAQLAALIEDALRERLPATIRVLGEISNFTHRTHWYFSLKESQVGGAVVSCVLFAGRTKSVGFVPSEGQQVVLTGRVEYYKPQGKISFYVEKIEPVGAGALELAFKALCAELKALGYFDPDRKRVLPTFPRRIAVITSKTGAALQDVISTVNRRCPAVQLALVDVLVQGPVAAPAIAKAIRWVSVNHARLGIDALLVTRGGGSIEDLWAFNDRAVADAIYQCDIPVVAAIGHETDTTIAELVADERCSTPTQAAMRLTPDREELAEQLDLTASSLTLALRRLLERARAALDARRDQLAPVVSSRIQSESRRLADLGASLARLKPAAVLHARRVALEQLGARLRECITKRVTREDVSNDASTLTAAFKNHLASRREQLRALASQLQIVGPMSVLSRGYSLTSDEAGRVIRRVSDARAGSIINTRVSDGEFRSVIGDRPPHASVPIHGTLGESVRRPPADQADSQTPLAPASPTAPKPKPRTRKPDREDDQPGLF